MIYWDKPHYLFLIAFIAVIIYLFWNLNQWRKAVRDEFADASLREDVFRSRISSWLNMKTIFLILSLFFMVMALMGPLWGEEEQRLKREGIDLVFALDLSNSMNAEDIAPSRLSKARNFIVNFMNQLGGDRVGLVIFAGDAYAVSPLTSDYQALTTFVETFETNLLWDQGTNFAAALKESIQILGNNPETSKAVVLISDGEDHEKEVEDEVDRLMDNEVHVFAVGVGKEVPVPIPMTTPDGWDDGYKQDDNGNTVLTSYRGESLRGLAAKTGGAYMKLERIDDAVNQLKSGLDNLEKKTASQISTFNHKQQYQWFLGVSILFFVMYSLTPENKKIKQ